MQFSRIPFSSGSSPTTLPVFIASLIERAAVSFDVDLAASRDYLFRAFAMLRAQVQAPDVPTGDTTRGRLATWQTKRTIAFIEANLSRPIQAADLAKLADLSVGHFSRAFKISVGVPPNEYICRRRVDLACELMRSTQEPLSQIALTCGLNDQSSLCRLFRRVVGRSPGEWRRDHAIGPAARSTPTKGAQGKQNAGQLSQYDQRSAP
jgi:AraC family transcriptional regulator